MAVINQDFFDFIEKNKDKDPSQLRLALKQKDYNFDLDFAITQIECRKKTAGKLKDFLSYPKFIFPDAISAEQSSHQAVAKYHSKLKSGTLRVLDMTAGLGIDAISFAQNGALVTAIELNPLKAEILQINVRNLDLSKLETLAGDSIEYLKNTDLHYDVIFVDPSRRGDANKRLYNLRDCSPDVLNNQEILLQHADKVLIKASPLLDLTQTLKDFQNITAIRTIGVKGECKELLIELDSNRENREIIIEAINLDNDGNILSEFSDELRNEETQAVEYATEKELTSEVFILEPSAMVMKLQPWNSICRKFNAKKLGKSSHIFLTTQPPEKFPGRVTKLKKIIKKQDRKTLSGIPASVISRNHPLFSEEIRKSFKLKEGDQNFIYATRLGEKPIMFLTETFQNL
ncbi:MAG: class I SAM-dependent methyltransferase [Muribaculaceae bacterium]|nr:class I SAM-dependent methyltransferase [Muribaculaceae bacterium]